jgi:hypothetical protein
MPEIRKNILSILYGVDNIDGNDVVKLTLSELRFGEITITLTLDEWSEIETFVKNETK